MHPLTQHLCFKIFLAVHFNSKVVYDVFDILPFVRYFTPLDWCSQDVTSNNTWYSSVPALLPATQVYNPVMFPWAAGTINPLFFVLFWSVLPSRDHEIHGWGLPVTWHGKTADSPSDTFISAHLPLLFLIRGGAGKVKTDKMSVAKWIQACLSGGGLNHHKSPSANE